MALNYKKEGGIAVFTIDRPEVMNAINMEVHWELSRTLMNFREDPELFVGIITGAGEKAFCAGADVSDALPFAKENWDKAWTMPATHMRGLELWKPLIAAVNGLALGGGFEIALACDLRIASENARFGTPEVNLGLIPGECATQRLPRMIPWCKAAEILLMGKVIDAEEAHRIGLVNELVPLQDLMPTARKWAETICKKGPLAVRAAKEAMIRGTAVTLEEGLRLERSLFGYLTGTEDYVEGTEAFLEKRKPVFKGK
jgi:enoyl-CoA hydratase